MTYTMNYVSVNSKKAELKSVQAEQMRAMSFIARLTAKPLTEEEENAKAVAPEWYARYIDGKIAEETACEMRNHTRNREICKGWLPELKKMSIREQLFGRFNV